MAQENKSSAEGQVLKTERGAVQVLEQARNLPETQGKALDVAQGLDCKVGAFQDPKGASSAVQAPFTAASQAEATDQVASESLAPGAMIPSGEFNRELEEFKHGLTKAEVNFLQYPIGTLDPHYERKRKRLLKEGRAEEADRIVFKTMVRDKDQLKCIEWKVIAATEYGLPGPTAVELDNAITKIIQDPARRVDGEVPKVVKTTYYELAKEMRRKPCGSSYKQIQKDLTKLASISIISESTFKIDGKFRTGGDGIFRKYEAVIRHGEDVPRGMDPAFPEGGKAKVAYIILNDIYWASLRKPNFYTKTINYNLMMSLKNPTAERLYQLLSLGFQTRMSTYLPDGRACLNYNYLELCGRMPMTSVEKRHHAKSNLKRHISRLFTVGYLEKFDDKEPAKFEFEGTQDRWYVRFFPGPRAKEELEYVDGQLMWWSMIEPKVKAVGRKKAKEGKPSADLTQKKREDDQAAEEAEKVKKVMEEAQTFLEGLTENEKQETLKLRDQIAVERFGTFSESELSKKYALVEAVEKIKRGDALVK